MKNALAPQPPTLRQLELLLSLAGADGIANAGARIIVNDIGTSLGGQGASATPAQQTKLIIEQRGGQAEISTESVAVTGMARMPRWACTREA